MIRSPQIFLNWVCSALASSLRILCIRKVLFILQNRVFKNSKYFLTTFTLFKDFWVVSWKMVFKNGFRICQWYQSGRGRDDRRARHIDRDLGSFKLKNPSFQGKNNPKAYLEWEKKVELLVDCHKTSYYWIYWLCYYLAGLTCFE